MITQAGLWAAAGLAAAMTLVSGLADHRRAKRKTLEEVGWVPWPLVQMLALLSAVVLAALAVLGRGL